MTKVLRVSIQTNFDQNISRQKVTVCFDIFQSSNFRSVHQQTEGNKKPCEKILVQQYLIRTSTANIIQSVDSFQSINFRPEYPQASTARRWQKDLTVLNPAVFKQKINRQMMTESLDRFQWSSLRSGYQ